MRNVKTKAIPAITGENGTVSEPFGQYLSNIEGNNEIKELGKQLYRALHIFRKVLVLKDKTFNMGDNIACNIT